MMGRGLVGVLSGSGHVSGKARVTVTKIWQSKSSRRHYPAARQPFPTTMSNQPPPPPPPTTTSEATTKRPTRPGRSSRRRKRKARSILDAASLLLSTERNAPSTTMALPVDRGTTLPGVFVRRRQERQRRIWRGEACRRMEKEDECHGSTMEASTQSHDNNDDDGREESLDPTDEVQLLSQLGFLPGNAVCVAARLSPEFLRDDDSSSSSPTRPRTSLSPTPPPSVLKLYPMAVRDSYRGGKSEGRKFKGRKRGCSRTTDTTTTTDDSIVVESTCNPPIPNSTNRCWYIHAPTSPSSSSHSPPTNKQQIIEPFPTLYWLTSPHLRSYISQLELSPAHNVTQMEGRLRSSPSNLSQMARAHTSYGQKRWELLTSADREEVLRRGWKEALDGRRGVAGIRPRRSGGEGGGGEGEEVWDGVKCLHAHAAHFLAQVEEWREERLRQRGSGEETEEELLSTLIRECDREDLNLVGKWTMEAVLDLVSASQT
eukprot:CCRYP_000519-RB/>CCRYP_000519-RB protein AED:0.38 eAED:0.38 QI:346/0/0.5/1/0/0/2/0/485